MQKSKVALAVEPLRKDTLEQAKIRTRERIASALEKLAAHDWNPYNFPGASMHPQFDIARKVTRQDQKRFGWFREQSDRSEQYYLDLVLKGVDQQFDSYVRKLEAKIGAEVAEAKLEGGHGNSLWGYSLLKIRLNDGSTQTWKTQLIWNISKLGLVFPQFPTRKLKE